MSAELIHLECPTAVHLEGHHVARDLIIETESFTTSDMKNSTKIESHTSGRTIGMNLMSAVVGAAMSMMASTATASPAMSSMLGSAASVSNTTVNQTMRQVVHEPTTVVADRFILRAGSAHLTDTQIRARLVDAIIRKDLVIQSIADEFFSESNGGGFSAGLGFLGLVQGVRNMTDLAASMGGMGAHVVDVEEIDRRVNNFASLVGEEQFNLVVGGTLLAQSAFYGQKEHGEKVSAPRNEVPAASTASEHIEAGRIQHEIVPEEHSFEDESFNIPLGDLISLVSTLTPKEELAKAVADDMKAQGKSNKEAMEAAQETKAIVVVSETARRKVATRKKAAVAKVRHALIEKAPDVAAQSFRMDDDAFIAFVEQYACEHPNDSIAREWSIASMILAQEQRAIYLEAARQFEALPLSEKAKRYAEVARDAALEYANEFSADPLAHTKDLASGLGYFALDMAVPGGIDPAMQWWNGEMSGNQAAALWGVCVGIDVSGGYLIEKGGKVLKTIGKAAVRGGEKLTTRVIEKIAGENIAKKRTIGQVGRYGDLTSGVLKDGLQAHHIPSDAFMHRYGIARNDGLAVILTKEQHKATRTYGAKNKRILSNTNSTARSELAADIWDVRNILRREGLYNKEVNRNLMKGMTDFRQKYPEIFKKVKK